jgi:hypothetical protein
MAGSEHGKLAKKLTTEVLKILNTRLIGSLE